MPRGQVRVSYLITTRNRAEFLERTLTNVREFIEPQDELIVIDGGSSDGTAELAARSADVISQFVSERDLGEGHAFNKGLFLSRGRYIKPITDDDYFYPEAMRKLVSAIEANPDIDAIQCGGERWIVEAGESKFCELLFLPDHMEPTAEAIFDNAACGLGILIRRSALMQTGGVSNNYVSVDGDLICRLVECGCRLRYLDVNLFRVYLRPHSNGNRAKDMERDRLRIAIRLGRWDSILRRDPRLLVSIAPEGLRSEDSEMLSKLWLFGRLVASPLWRIAAAFLQFLLGLLRAAGSLKRLIGAPRSRQPADLAQPESARTWSGRLA